MSERQKRMVSNATPKWFKRMKFWNLVTAVITPVASGEIILLFSHVTLPVWVHSVVGVLAALSIYIKIFIKDVDGDGITD